MFAWPVSRLAGLVARMCGASPEGVNAARIGVAAILTPIDPIGGGIGLAHAAVGEAARQGSEGAKVANTAMTVASWVIVPMGDVDVGDVGTATCPEDGNHS